MRVLAVALCLLSCFAFQRLTLAAAPGAGTALQAQARTTLGVGVRSLAFLFDAGPGRFVLKVSLVDDGSWEKLVELEKAGYVTVQSAKTPDGEYVQILLTDSGEALRKEIIAAEG